MNPLVATKSSIQPFSGRFPGKPGAFALALMLGLASGAFAAGEASVNLAWNPNPEPDVAGYRLLYGTTSGTYPNTVNAGALTNATASGLNQGTTYYFVVVAYNSAGQTSPPSSVLSYTVPGTPNTAPGATPFPLTVAEDGQVAATLSGTDAEGDSLTFSVVTAPAKGSFTGTAPNLTYRPNANATGSDSFTYRASDGVLNSAAVTVSITITPVNDAPVATAKSVNATEDNAVVVALAGTDVEGDSLSYSIVSQPGKGSLSGTPPNVTYTPAPNANGSDSFTFRVYDGTDYSAAATVSLNIAAVNDVPVATARSASTSEDTAVAVTLSGTDVEGSSLTYSIVNQPGKGSLSGTPPNVTYTPALNANGSDSFSFRVNDGAANSAAATVSLSIAAVNDPPVAAAKSVTTSKNNPVAVVVSGSDVEGSPLTYAVVTPPAKGILSGSAPNFTYTPNTDVTGSDSFTYRVNDGSVNSAAATVSISISNGNQKPLAESKSLATMKNVAVDIELSGSDAESSALSYRVVNPPGNGVLSGTPPKLKFVPEAKFVGNVSFTYVANDGSADSAPATVTVKVKSTNKKPVATADTVVANQDATTALVLAGTDPDADALTFAVVKQPRNGTLTGTPPNVSYLPNSGFLGEDSFTFVVNDGVINSTAATIGISVVNPNNLAPVAASWAVSTPMRTAVPVTLVATDADGDPLRFRLSSKPANGRLTGKAPNLVFKPKAKFTGTTSFTYVANDGSVDSAPITVVINVTGVPVTAARSLARAKEEGAAEPLPELALRMDPARPGILRLEITGVPGESYQLQHSPDLASWADERAIEIGDSGSLSLEVLVPLEAPRGFYRLRTP